MKAVEKSRDITGGVRRAPKKLVMRLELQLDDL